ncbi:uncharacterized protein LOC134824887 isoform X1 [Bolinopsis microptera]|uniref:uncharacterized protein LOC134824887 isoform X1 n=1 Tax=Bolinopsis microptera TaxID=2820187 RepID=UPI00307A135C
MAAVKSPMVDQDGTFGRLHRDILMSSRRTGLKSNEEVDWKERDPKPIPVTVRRQSSTFKRFALANQLQESDVKTSVSLAPSKVLDTDTGLQLSMKANSILGGSTWTQNLEKEFVKLDAKSSNVTAGEEEGAPTVLSGSEEPREQSVFHLTETEKYILKQIMNMTHDRAGLQAHRKLAETHLVRVQTHMEEAQPSEIAQGGYIHLPDRTKMKRHYMKKLGRKATKTEVQVPKECCTMLGNVAKYDPARRRHDLKNTIIPLIPGSLPNPEFRFRHVFVVDMAYMEKNKVDLTNDRVPVFSAAHPGDKYLFSKEISEEIKARSKRLLAAIRIAFNNRLYWKDVLKGKSKPTAVLEDTENEEVYKRECEQFISNPLSCRSMMYYVDVYDPTQEYDCPSQGYVGVLETSPRLLAVQEGEKFKERLMSHICNDGSLFETCLSLPRLWRHNFYNSTAGSDGVLDRAPSVIVLPLDFGLAGGVVKSKQTDRLRYLEGRYMKYFGGVSPVTLNMKNPVYST